MANRATMKLYRTVSKRLIDVVIGAALLACAFPVMAIVALCVRLTGGAPVLFRQSRPGLNGRPFTLFKFRTMSDARNASGEVLADAARLTPLGRFLRATSL